MPETKLWFWRYSFKKFTSLLRRIWIRVWSMKLYYVGYRRQKIHCCLQIGKAKVSPKKFVPRPRIELTTAVLSVRVANQSKRELSLNGDREIFWTDCQVVLGYIKNGTKKFIIFVANWVQFIQENTKKDQWKYIPTKQNPADLSFSISGIEADSARKVHVWNYGPDFLWTD